MIGPRFVIHALGELHEQNKILRNIRYRNVASPPIFKDSKLLRSFDAPSYCAIRRRDI